MMTQETHQQEHRLLLRKRDNRDDWKDALSLLLLHNCWVVQMPNMWRLYGRKIKKLVVYSKTVWCDHLELICHIETVKFSVKTQRLTL
jgi:hypothetical protein